MTAVPVCSTKVLVRYEQSKGEYKIWSNRQTLKTAFGRATVHTMYISQ